MYTYIGIKLHIPNEYMLVYILCSGWEKGKANPFQHFALSSNYDSFTGSIIFQLRGKGIYLYNMITSVVCQKMHKL